MCICAIMKKRYIVYASPAKGNSMGQLEKKTRQHKEI